MIVIVTILYLQNWEPYYTKPFVALTLILRPEPFLKPTPTRMLNLNFTNVNEYLYFSPNIKKNFNLPRFIWRTCLTDKGHKFIFQELCCSYFSSCFLAFVTSAVYRLCISLSLMVWNLLPLFVCFWLEVGDLVVMSLIISGCFVNEL